MRSPKLCCQASAYCSVASLLAAYGLRGRVASPSCLGSSGLAPYTDDDDATITWASSSRRASSEHSHRADGVRFVGGDRIVDRPGDRRARGEVDDALCPGGCVGEGVGVEDRPGDQTDFEVVEVGGGSRRQVVDPDDLVAVAQQSLTDVGADEPCGTGDEDPHSGEPSDRVGCHRVPLAGGGRSGLGVGSQRFVRWRMDARR